MPVVNIPTQLAIMPLMTPKLHSSEVLMLQTTNPYPIHYSNFCDSGPLRWQAITDIFICYGNRTVYTYVKANSEMSKLKW